MMGRTWVSFSRWWVSLRTQKKAINYRAHLQKMTLYPYTHPSLAGYDGLHMGLFWWMIGLFAYEKKKLRAGTQGNATPNFKYIGYQYIHCVSFFEYQGSLLVNDGSLCIPKKNCAGTQGTANPNLKHVGFQYTNCVSLF